VLIALSAVPARGQAPPRIGVLTPAAAQWDAVAFREGLRDLGYVEGQNVTLDVRSGEGRLDRMPELAADLVRRGARVILAVNTPGTRAAMNATRTLPIVAVAIGDPVALGFVTNLARPDGNITGVSNMAGDLGAKRLELLKEALPDATRIALLLHPDEPIVDTQLRDLRPAARRLGVEFRQFPLRSNAEVERVLDEVVRWRADAILRLAGQALSVGARTAEVALRRRVPAMLLLREEAEAGALLTYFADQRAVHRRAAYYVDRILRGAQPRDLPVEQPTQFDLVINLKTARALGLTLPPTLLLRADKLIQ
jgi:putative ABC transport system substrate-binding protein